MLAKVACQSLDVCLIHRLRKQARTGWAFIANETVDNSGFFDFYRAFPAVDVALAGTGHGQLGFIHILVDG